MESKKSRIKITRPNYAGNKYWCFTVFYKDHIYIWEEKTLKDLFIKVFILGGRQ